jgi:predicted nucleotidyltransferase
MTLIDNNNILIAKEELPQTYKILTSGGLLIDDRIKAVFISGSRGPAGGFRPDSDIDISLVLDREKISNPYENETVLNSILSKTLKNWISKIELDTAIIFDIEDCDFECFLKCFNSNDCEKESADCFGIYKIQKGFDGFVPQFGVEVRKVFPIRIVWKR